MRKKAGDPGRAAARREQLRRAISTETPYSRPAKRLEDGDEHDQLTMDLRYQGVRQEALLDEAIEETFPASDPIAPTIVD